jgi:hypothetical protein
MTNEWTGTLSAVSRSMKTNHPEKPVEDEDESELDYLTAD